MLGAHHTASLEIAVPHTDPATLIAAFTSLPAVERVIASGDTKASVDLAVPRREVLYL